MSEEHFLGNIQVSPRAIGSIAGQAVLESYGVVGMSSKRLRDNFSALLPHGSFRQGVEVKYVNERVVIDLYVIIEYGTRISQVAQGIKTRVKYVVERDTGLPIAEVNVHVQGLRVSKQA